MTNELRKKHMFVNAASFCRCFTTTFLMVPELSVKQSNRKMPYVKIHCKKTKQNCNILTAKVPEILYNTISLQFLALIYIRFAYIWSID